MVICYHKSCGREERVWLPRDIKTSDFMKFNGKSFRYDDVALHHWCIKCGCIKNISDDRPKKIGYWINLLSAITKKYKITQTQKRLICKELGSYEFFDDIYGITGSAQREIFIKTVRKYCGINERIIDSYIF
jgi:hypothetical protein